MTSDRLAYFEWSAPEDSDLDNPDSLRLANPSYGIVRDNGTVGITDEFSRLERAAMTDDEYARERLGIFPDNDDAPKWKAIPEAWWAACADTPAEGVPWLTGPVALAIEMPADRSKAWICSAGRVDGRIGGDIKAQGPGSSWVVDTIVTLKADTEHPIGSVVIDPRSPAGSLIKDLKAAGVDVLECPTADLVKATGQLTDAIAAGEFRHRRNPDLTAAVAAAEWRKAGESKVIDRWSDQDASAFIGVTLARFGLLQPGNEPYAAAVYA